MKAQELRIGNYIESYNTNGNPMEWVLWHIHSSWQLQEVEEMEGKKEWFRPIPLTEEWLLKAGFKSVRGLHPTFKIRNFLIEENLMRTGKYYLRQIMNKQDSLCISKEIEYVHQLQNLYFCLTGEELTIKQ